MIKYYRIEDPNKPGSYYEMMDGTCEFVNPVYQAYEVFVETRLRYIIALSSKDQKISYDDFVVLKYYILIDWQEHKKNVFAHTVPKEFFELFGTSKKKDQIKLLANSTLSLEDFEAFMYQSWDPYGYKFSKYVFNHHPVEFEIKEKPKVIFRKSSTDIRTVGKTDMTKGQLNALIEKRNVIVANFFDKGEEWHCLFLTYKGITGKELDHLAEPHMHYISNAFGKSRSQVIESFEKTRYSLDSIYIPFTGFNPMVDTELIEKADF
jgi:hypothetical protein